MVGIKQKYLPTPRNVIIERIKLSTYARGRSTLQSRAGDSLNDRNSNPLMREAISKHGKYYRSNRSTIVGTISPAAARRRSLPSPNGN